MTVRVGEAILIVANNGTAIMYSRNEYDAQLLMYAIYDVNMVDDGLTDFLGEIGDE